MKTFSIKFLFLALVAFMSLTTSCKKDNDDVKPVSSDSVVGLWDVVDGEADVYVNGTKFEVQIATSGTLSFDGDGKGMADFTMTFMDDTDEISGPFSWERDGFELIVTSGGEQRRWALVDDEENNKTVQFTEPTGDGDEVEFTLILERKN